MPSTPRPSRNQNSPTRAQITQTTGRRRFFNSKKLCEIEVVPEVLPEVAEDALQKALGPEHVSVSADDLHLHFRAGRLG